MKSIMISEVIILQNKLQIQIIFKEAELKDKNK